MKTDILKIPTVTLALKAKRILGRHRITANVIKIDATTNKNGCAYAIEIPSSDFFSAITLIREADIPYGTVSKGEKR